MRQKQCVQIGNHSSTFQNTTRGVPQGSLLGTLLFNICLNDIKLFNYADDNTLPFSHPVFVTLVEIIRKGEYSLAEWFTRNQMKANPSKFQTVAVGKRTNSERPSFRIGGSRDRM